MASIDGCLNASQLLRMLSVVQPQHHLVATQRIHLRDDQPTGHGHVLQAALSCQGLGRQALPLRLVQIRRPGLSGYTRSEILVDLQHIGQLQRQTMGGHVQLDLGLTIQCLLGAVLTVAVHAKGDHQAQQADQQRLSKRVARHDQKG